MAADRVEDKLKAQLAEKESFETELELLDKKIARLRVMYDQYFMGIEKVEPQQLRSEIAKIFMRSTIPQRGGTALKFRYRGLQQRFVAYGSYWDRIVRLLEDGKIRRGVNVFTAEDSHAVVEPQSGQQPDGSYVLPEALVAKRRRFRPKDKKPGDQPEAATAAATAGGEPRPEVAPPRTEFDPGEVDAIFERLVAEKTRVGEATDKLNREVVARSIGKILEKVTNPALRLRIIEKDGRVSLAAVLKKG